MDDGDRHPSKGGSRVVVGVDGSPAADRAVAWAASEAALRRAALEIVHAEFARRELLVDYPGLERPETEVLVRAAELARRAQPDLEVTTSLYEPPAAVALIRASAGADMLVVGSRGRGEGRSLVLGSVSVECLHRARCPVAVVPCGTSSTSPDGAATGSQERPGAR